MTYFIRLQLPSYSRGKKCYFCCYCCHHRSHILDHKIYKLYVSTAEGDCAESSSKPSLVLATQNSLGPDSSLVQVRVALGYLKSHQLDMRAQPENGVRLLGDLLPGLVPSPSSAVFTCTTSQMWTR